MDKQKLSFQSYFVYEKDIIEPRETQSHQVQEDTQDTLVAWQLQTEVQILFLVILAGIITIIGFFNRKVEKALLFALFLSGIIFVVILGLLR